jgi:hypothetical protein
MRASERVKNIMSRLLLLFFIVSLCWALDSTLTETPITSDARQNLRAAYNLCTYGVFSTVVTAGKPSVDNCREPLVPFATSLLVRFYKKSDAALAFEDFSTGKMCRAVKQVNLYWAFILLVGSAMLILDLTGSTLFAALSTALIWLCFLRNPEHIDTLCTEVPAATIMVWVSVVLVRSLRSGRHLLFFTAGLLFGLLCLIKAVFLYLAVPIVLMIFLWNLIYPSVNKIRAVSTGVLFMVAIAAAVGPWMLRNYSHFGSFNLALRGGSVLYGRTLRNTMNMDEVVAAFYLWGPGAYKKMVANTFLEMSFEDYEEGGRAARLNRSADAAFERSDKIAQEAGRPQDAVSFYRQSTAEIVRLKRYYKSLDHPNPQQAADEYLKNEAKRWIFENPVRHVIMTVPFAWRGVWCFYGGGIFTILNAICYSTFMMLALYVFFRPRGDIVAFVLLPVCMLFFNAFLTHNLNRYSVPAIPYLIISLPVMISIISGRGVKKI